MFGNSRFKKVKTKKFKNDNERKKYFAIKKYYENKKNNVHIFDTPSSKKKKR